jgi:hypothetical protein
LYIALLYWIALDINVLSSSSQWYP